VAQGITWDETDHPAIRHLESDETVHAIAEVDEARILVTDRRLAVAEGGRIALDIPYSRLRRIQFDIERQRPATLVIVPERPDDPPQVLSVPRSRYQIVAGALATIGEHLHEVESA